MIKAPVGEVVLVDVPSELIENHDDEMAGFNPGITHGCRFVSRCIPAINKVQYIHTANRPRYAKLAFLYGWTVANDHQFCFEIPGYLVHSFDHGEFFPNGPQWNEESLLSCASVSIDKLIAEACRFDESDLNQAKPSLNDITEIIVANIIANVPGDWRITLEEKVALANFLLYRCIELRR